MKNQSNMKRHRPRWGSATWRRTGWRPSAQRLWRAWVKPFLLVILMLGSVRSVVADWNDVPTGSMKPTILVGDRIVVNKLAYDLKVPFTTWRVAEWADPQRGDIIVCFSPANGIRLVKRVIGIPGDRLAMNNNQLYINGVAVTYEPLDTETINQIPKTEQPSHRFALEKLGERPHALMTTPQLRALRSFGPVTLGKNQYFVMGDNRDCSADSRVFGVVPRDQIVGRAFAVAMSVDPERWYLPRWDRFFTGLD